MKKEFNTKPFRTGDREQTLEDIDINNMDDKRTTTNT